MNYHKINLKLLKNERGGMAALLSVIVLSMIMVSTLSSFYVYLENRAKHQGRLQMNYQMGYVVEDLGRAIAEARLAYNPATDTCPTGTLPRYLDCSKVCAISRNDYVESGLHVSGNWQYGVCVKNPTLNKILNNADYFCAYNSDPTGGVQIPTYCNDNELVKNDSSEGATIVASHSYKKTTINNWYSRLDNFFDTTLVKNAPYIANKMHPILEANLQPPTIFGWMLPQKAFAVSSGGQTYCQMYPDSPTCLNQIPPPNTDATITAAYTSPGGTPTDCETNPTLACQQSCDLEPSQSFCKNLKAAITVTQVGGTTAESAEICNNTAADPRCKRCGLAERNLGACLKISVCPPWIPEADCTSGGANGRSDDRRIHQMVQLNSTQTFAAAPVAGPSDPPEWAAGCCPNYTSPLCTLVPLASGCAISCSGNGTRYTYCQ